MATFVLSAPMLMMTGPWARPISHAISARERLSSPESLSVSDTIAMTMPSMPCWYIHRISVSRTSRSIESSSRNGV